MPRTVTTETVVYKYDELPESGKERVLERLANINVDHDWHDSTYEDAKNIGCNILSYDLGRGNEIGFVCMKPALEVAKLIRKNHGEQCDTYRLAHEFIQNHDPHDESGEQEKADEEFEQQLGECYLIMLRNEYEYQTSREAIEETIRAMDYEFTENGKLF
jgi:hypothetical protein